MAIAIGAGYAWLSRSTPSATTQGVAAVPVVTARVEARDLPLEFRALGNVKALRSLDVRPQVDGLLLELPVAEGARVEPGMLLARLDDRALRAAMRQAEAERDETRAELDIARVDLQRYTNLVKERAAPSQQLDQQKALVARLDATLSVREASVEAARVQLSYTRIQSPLRGRVGLRTVHEGSLVRTSDAVGLFSVVQTDPIAVEVAIPQQQLGDVQRMLAPAAHNRVEVYRQDGGELLAQGRLTLIDNQVARNSGTVRVRAEFANPDERLWPDQAVVVTLQTGMLRGVATVPTAALRQGAQGPSIWQVIDGRAEPRRVEVLAQQAERVAIEGLAVGDEVVVDGQSRLQRGSLVKIPTQDAMP